MKWEGEDKIQNEEEGELVSAVSDDVVGGELPFFEDGKGLQGGSRG